MKVCLYLAILAVITKSVQIGVDTDANFFLPGFVDHSERGKRGKNLYDHRNRFTGEQRIAME